MRINCIPPEDLLDQHLLSEYNEFAMLLSSLTKSLEAAKRKRQPLPKQYKYTLGKGHAIFFYDKGRYAQNRYEKLCAELKKRNYNLDPERELPWYKFDVPGWANWTPSYEDQLLNVSRILERFLLKPEWYTYYREPVNVEVFIEKYSNWSYKP